MESVIDSASYFQGELAILSFIVRELTGREYQINDFSYQSTVFILKTVLVGMSATVPSLDYDRPAVFCLISISG